jgi:DNA-binding NarL/FixJ family response regulator
MDSFALVNMDSHRCSFRPTLYIRSSHPLAFRTIEKTLASSPYEIKSFQSPQLQLVDEPNWVLILDTCSVEEWPELASECRLNGGRTIVLVSKHPRTPEELRLIYLGVHGIVPMVNIENELPRAVDSVVQGKLWVNRSTLDEYVKRSNRSTPAGAFNAELTVREEQIIVSLLRRFCNKEIADILKISERTVKFHVSNILQKLMVTNRKELQEIIKDTESSSDETPMPVAG